MTSESALLPILPSPVDTEHRTAVFLLLEVAFEPQQREIPIPLCVSSARSYRNRVALLKHWGEKSYQYAIGRVLKAQRCPSGETCNCCRSRASVLSETWGVKGKPITLVNPRYFPVPLQRNVHKRGGRTATT